MSSSNNKPEVLCKVCMDKASGKHYGVASCDGCRGFFKRSIRRQAAMNLDYACKDNCNCIVDVTRRNQCQFCRFQKCIKVGMKKEAVQHERANRCYNKKPVSSVFSVYGHHAAAAAAAAHAHAHNRPAHAGLELHQQLQAVRAAAAAGQLQTGGGAVTGAPPGIVSPLLPHSYYTAAMAAAAQAAFPSGRPFPGLFPSPHHHPVQHSQPSSTSSSPLQQPIRDGPASPSPLTMTNQPSAFSPVVSGASEGRPVERAPVEEKKEKAAHGEEEEADSEVKSHKSEKEEKDNNNEGLKRNDNIEEEEDKLKESEAGVSPSPVSPPTSNSPIHHGTNGATIGQIEAPAAPITAPPPPLQAAPNAYFAAYAALAQQEHHQLRRMQLIQQQQQQQQQQQEQQHAQLQGLASPAGSASPSGGFNSENIYESAARLLFVAVKWAKTIPAFAQLSQRDQTQLLEAAWPELFILSLGQWGVNIDEAALVRESLTLGSENVSPGMLSQQARYLKDLLTRIQAMKVDQTEFTCLKAMVLFRPEILSFRPHTQVDGLRDQTMLMLQDYATSSSGNNNSSLLGGKSPISGSSSPHMLRFGKLLLLLHSAAGVRSAALETLFFRKTVGNIAVERVIGDLCNGGGN